jgi:hypothetical protein
MHLHNRNCSFLSARTILGGLAVAVEINGYFWGFYRPPKITVTFGGHCSSRQKLTDKNIPAALLFFLFLSARTRGPQYAQPPPFRHCRSELPNFTSVRFKI